MWYVSLPLVTRWVNASIAAMNDFGVGDGFVVAADPPDADADEVAVEDRGAGRQAAATDAATTAAATNDAR
jgi:hypothetical protein